MIEPVLYAEDQADDVFFMRDAWSRAGLPHPFISVHDGQQAINYLAGNDPYADRKKHPLPCLLLLDLKLPRQSGFDVLRWIREHPTLNQLKVVIVSGSDHEADVAAARELGITDYIVKPPVPSRLVDIVRNRHARWLGDGAGQG